MLDYANDGRPDLLITDVSSMAASPAAWRGDAPPNPHRLPPVRPCLRGGADRRRGVVFVLDGDAVMTPAEIAKEAEFVAEHCFDHSREVVRIARALLAALPVVEALEDWRAGACDAACVDAAIVSFHKTVEGMKL